LNEWHLENCAGEYPLITVRGNVAICLLNFTLILISPPLLKNGLNRFSVTLLEEVVTQGNVSLVRLDAALVSVSMATGIS
jgi:hypothetical protein